MDSYDGAADYVFGDIPISRATRQPCMVCGHSTGDCTGTDHPPVRIIGADLYTNKALRDPGVLVPADIYDEVPLTPFTKTRVLIARAGSYIARDKAEKYGLTNR